MKIVIVVRNYTKQAVAAMQGEIEESLRRSAMVLEAEMKRKISSNIPPELKPATIRRKKSSQTLIDTGIMRSQITADYGHIRDDYVTVGVVGSRAGAAAVHEFGSRRRNIPERSFLRSSLYEPVEKIRAVFSEKFRKK